MNWDPLKGARLPKNEEPPKAERQKEKKLGGFLDEKATETEPEQIQARLDAVDKFLKDNESFFSLDGWKNRVRRVQTTE